MRRFAVLVVLMVLVGGSVVAATPDDRVMTVTLLEKNAIITAYEPVVARVGITNKTDCPISVLEAPGYSIRVEIRDVIGRLVGQTPLLPRPMDFLTSARALAPGQTMTSYLIISAIHTFKKPGEYSIRIMHGFFERGAKPSVTAEAAASIRVLPFNAARLNARLKDIYDPLRALPKDLRAFPMQARLWAIQSVRHDAALPYLEMIAKKWGDHSAWLAIRAMRRVGTPKAKALVRALTARKDRLGVQAQTGLRLPLRVTEYDWQIHTH